MLTEDLARDDQLRLGILLHDPDQPDGPRRPFPIKRLYWISSKLQEKANWTEESVPGLTDDERQTRRRLLTTFTDNLLRATLLGDGSGCVAVDGTHMWAWYKAPRRAALDKLVAAAEDWDTARCHGVELDPDQPAYDPDRAESYLADRATELNARSHDHDASWGVKTRKHGGKELCFGRQLSIAVRVPHPDEGDNPTTIPQIVGMALSPGADWSCQGLVDT